MLLRWALQKGFAVIPKSSSKDRIVANAELDFVLDDAEMRALDALGASPCCVGGTCQRGPSPFRRCGGGQQRTWGVARWGLVCLLLIC